MNKLLKVNAFFPAVFVLSISVFLAHTAFTKTAIFADGRFYYATTRSIVKDFDIKLANEFKLLGMPESYTKGNYSWNKYPPGSSFFWIPLYSQAEGLNNLLTFVCPLQMCTQLGKAGFGLIYQTSVAITGAILGTLGLYLIFILLKEHFPKTQSLMSVLSLFAATNLFFYIAVEPINSHTSSFFVSSLFTYYFIEHRKDKYYYPLLGILGGIAGLVRTQDLLILILPIIQITKENYKNIPKLVADNLSLIATAILAFTPQVYFWKKIFGIFWYSPYLSEGINLKSPKLIYVLFNGQNGLFSLTPIILLAFLGLIIILKNRSAKLKLISLYAIVYFTLQLYLISSWSSYYQGGSFGIRMIITTYPFLAFGLAEIVNILSSRLGSEKSWGLIATFSLINQLLMVRYLLLF